MEWLAEKWEAFVDKAQDLLEGHFGAWVLVMSIIAITFPIWFSVYMVSSLLIFLTKLIISVFKGEE